MATLRTRWLLSILLVNLSGSFAAAGPPSSPPPPECFIPCNKTCCGVDIYCSWSPWHDQIPTNYSLHWKPTDSEEGQVIPATSFSEMIQREHFPFHGGLRVWVQYGSVKSQEAKFNTAYINKPPPPESILIHQETLEIEWKLHCEQLHVSVGPCKIRHRIQANKDWLEEDVGCSDRYAFDSLKPCTVYEFQVRCACHETLMSDWSAVDTVQPQDAAPDGELDVWRDCRISPPSFDCVPIWKKLPLSQACGLILGYEVRLFDSNGSAKLTVNLSTTETRGLLVCDEMQCYFNSSLKDVSSVGVSAYNTHGSTVPSYLTVPRLVTEKIDQGIKLNMTEDHLTVSWDLPSQLSDHIKEYVVEYKQVGHPRGKGFDWVKVPKNQTQASFKGLFIKYAAYQVSLMTILHSNEVRHLSSAIGYSLQGIPPTVSFFAVSNIAADRVVLFWMPVPLTKQNGLILFYQIGVNSENVRNVSAFPYHENKTLELQDLKPSQDYIVSIRAVTAAGPGEKVTKRFTTKDPEDFVRLILPVCGVGLLVAICLFVVLYGVCRSENKACVLVPPCLYEKVPDPGNSHIFTQMKPQINEPFSWICFPASEPQPNISLLEVVERREKASDSEGLNKPVVRGGCTQVDSPDDHREDTVTECHKTDRRYGRQAYSKMIDSDEERDKEEEMGSDSWNSSQEEPCKSGYEKHFMPTSLEILEVS